MVSDKRLNVKKGRLVLNNPVVAASGTFGYGLELESMAHPENYGGISLKGITLNPRSGNDSPRLVEVCGGVINSVGLQNDGVDCFLDEKITPLSEYDTAIIANISGGCEEDYFLLAEKLDVCAVDYIEINVSCPNLKEGGVVFGRKPEYVASISAGVRQRTEKPLILKLTPQVTDIKEIVVAAEENGIDVIALINTYPAMAIDIFDKKPVLGNIKGGFSGPAVKPMAINLVWEARSATDLPIIGMGGVSGWEDAVEFMLAGADAVGVGTWHFIDPSVAQKINTGLIKYMEDNDFSSIEDISGYVWRKYND